VETLEPNVTASLIRHLEHAVGVCGEDHVGLGTDGDVPGIALNEDYAKYQRKFFEDRAKAGIAAPGEAADVFNLIPEYNQPRRFETLANDLAQRGWTAGRIEKILGRNFAPFIWRRLEIIVIAVLARSRADIHQRQQRVDLSHSRLIANNSGGPGPKAGIWPIELGSLKRSFRDGALPNSIADRSPKGSTGSAPKARAGPWPC
jgi:hypothetical protein